jgi:L,D-peptidoglycan transpeptidase YkuD (ErfK/YbiS/YcfS/YnhG family)
VHPGLARTGLVALATLVLPLTACTSAEPAAAPEADTAQAAPAQELTAATTAASCAGIPRKTTAKQVLVVDGSGTKARVTACSRTASGGYQADFGPFDGRVGQNGVAVKGAKREGDGKTPSGAFPLRGGFGTAANPETKLRWMRVTRNDVWVDDSRSKLYNTHQVLPVRGRWTSAEQLYIRAYKYAQVIGYNEGRKPGMGSAIFLHLDTGRATAGCVSLPSGPLLKVLRWQKPGAVIVITR